MQIFLFIEFDIFTPTTDTCTKKNSKLYFFISLRYIHIWLNFLNKIMTHHYTNGSHCKLKGEYLFVNYKEI